MNPVDERFLQAALAENGMPIAAGWVPPPRSPEVSRRLLPTLEEIERLPRWARVAFAARCARRVLPLYHHLWPEAAAEHNTVMFRGVVLAEQSAALGHGSVPECETARREVSNLSEDAAAAGAELAATVATTIEEVVLAAQSAVEATANGTKDHLAPSESELVQDAVRGAIDSLIAGATLNCLWSLTGPVRDLDRLVHLSQASKWADSTPVPPTVFGPMWERQPPPWWTALQPADSSPVAQAQQSVPDEQNRTPEVGTDFNFSRN